MRAYDEFIRSISDGSKHTLRVYQTSIPLFLEYFEIQNVEDIAALKHTDFQGYKEHLQKTLSASSVNSRLRPVSSFLGWLYRNEYVTVNVAEKVQYAKQPKTVKAIPTHDEYEQMLAACDTLQKRVMLRLIFELGLRRSEITKVKLSDVANGRLTVHGKGNKERSLLVKPDLLEEVQKLCAEQGTDYIVVSRRGHHSITGDSVYLRVKTIAEQAIGPERAEIVTPHGGRHRFVTDVLKVTGDIRTAQVLAGHASISTTERYAHVENPTLDAALMAI